MYFINDLLSTEKKKKQKKMYKYPKFCSYFHFNTIFLLYPRNNNLNIIL